MKKILLVLLMISSTAMADGNSPNEELFDSDLRGSFAGGAGGALAGSYIGKGNGSIPGIAVGALVGMIIGWTVGTDLDKSDLDYANRNTFSALNSAPDGVMQVFKNPETGSSGSTTMVSTVMLDNRFCRHYQLQVAIVNAYETVYSYGTACKQNDGTWITAN